MKIKALIILITIGLLGIILISISERNNSDTISENVHEYRDSQIIKTVHEKSEVEVELEVAASESKRAEGLMFRESMGENSGMLFIFDKPQELTFWMKNTLISLDIIYLNEEFEVITLHKSTKREQISEVYPSNGLAKYVIELNSGWSETHNLSVGDTFSILE